MQQTIGGRQTQTAQRAPRFKIPRLWFIIMLLVIVFLLMIAAASTLAVRPDESSPSDPFAPYADLFPDQQIDLRQLEQKGFVCQPDSNPAPSDTSVSCSHHLQTGPFMYMSLVIRDGFAHWLTFSVREQSLMLGHLILLWGVPEIMISGNWMAVRWNMPGRIIRTGWMPYGEFNYLQPVTVLSFAMET